MAIISAQNLTMGFGENTLFEKASFELAAGERVGLVGANGTGKTTLFKLITGAAQPAEGAVYTASGIRFGLMEQHACAGSKRGVYDEMLSVFDYLIKAEKELEALASAIHEGADDIDALIARQHNLTEEYERFGGLTCRSRTNSALAGLGFSKNDFDLPCAKLSGGQKSKLSLGKLLLSRAEYLLLDEPTNHLDIDSVEWLETFLRDFKGGALIISHDRLFLDRVTQKTLAIEHKKITLWDGNYSRHLQLKAEKEAVELKQYRNEIKEIHRIEGIIEQQRRWGREKNIIKAESKEKMLQKKREALVKPEGRENTLRFGFKPEAAGGNEVLKVEKVAKAFAVPLFENVVFRLFRGERTFLLGPNGCGKTTLMRIIAGELPPDKGAAATGAGIRIGYFHQTLEGLHDEKSVLREVWDTRPDLTETEIRKALAVFLFKGDEVFRRVGTFSGGEKARASLLKLMLSGANFLLLDEPTNHLDIPSREAVERALLDFEGTLLVVSHDRYFINKLATGILLLTPGGVERFDGNYDACFEKMRDILLAPRPGVKEAPPPKPNEFKLRKERESEQKRLAGKIRRLEQTIEAVEKQAAELAAELEKPEIAADYEKVLEISARLDTVNTRLEELLAEWETLARG